MATPAQDPTAGILSDIKLIRDQIDTLQVAFAEKKSPWYKQPSILLSVIALVVSIIGGLISYYHQASKDQEQDRAQKAVALQQLTVEIVDINKQMLDLADIKDQVRAANISGMLNTKREIMISRATNLVNELQPNVPSDILYMLATQEQGDGHVSHAEALYLEALKHSSDLTQYNVHRSLASLYMIPHTPIADLEKGRKQFQIAIDSLAAQRDENSISQRGFTYDYWGQMEFLNDKIDQGKKMFANAQREYEGLSLANPGRQFSLNNLAVHKAQSFRATSAASAAMARLAGNWEGADGNMHIQLRINLGNDGVLQATMYGAQPIAGAPPITGTISLEDDSVSDFAWSMPGNYLVPLGSSKLRLDPVGKTLQLDQFMNGRPQTVILTKA